MFSVNEHYIYGGTHTRSPHIITNLNVSMTMSFIHQATVCYIYTHVEHHMRTMHTRGLEHHSFRFSTDCCCSYSLVLFIIMPFICVPGMLVHLVRPHGRTNYPVGVVVATRLPWIVFFLHFCVIHSDRNHCITVTANTPSELFIKYIKWWQIPS